MLKVIMFILNFMGGLVNVVVVAMPSSGFFYVLTGIIYSLAKGDFSGFIVYILFFVVSILTSGTFLLLGLALSSTMDKEKSIILKKAQTIISFILALAILVLGLRTILNFDRFQIYVSFSLGFMVAGILFWKEIPDKLLGNTFNRHKS